MGRKGPIAVFVMGVGAIIVFGLMAKLLFDRNPVAAAIMSYKQVVHADYPVSGVSLIRERDGFRLQILLEPDAVADLPKGPAEDPPPPFTDLRAHFRRNFELNNSPKHLRLYLLAPGGGCRSEETLWSHDYDLARERREMVAEIRKLLGKPASLRMEGPDTLKVQTAASPPAKTLARVAVVLSRYAGGNWKTITIRAAGRAHTFDDRGQPRK